MKTRIAFAILSAALLAAGCAPVDREKLKAEVIATDKAFSALAQKEGAKAAFLAYVDSDGKLLTELKHGRAGVESAFLQFAPNSRLSWEPSFAQVSESGDIAYTWGRYQLTLPEVQKTRVPRLHLGTYVTIWKHERDGTWKFVFEGGNLDRE